MNQIKTIKHHERCPNKKVGEMTRNEDALEGESCECENCVSNNNIDVNEYAQKEIVVSLFDQRTYRLINPSLEVGNFKTTIQPVYLENGDNSQRVTLEVNLVNLESRKSVSAYLASCFMVAEDVFMSDLDHIANLIYSMQTDVMERNDAKALLYKNGRYESNFLWFHKYHHDLRMKAEGMSSHKKEGVRNGKVV